MAVFQFIGRLHPLILHLPIGILLLAFIMMWIARKEQFAYLRPAVGFALRIGVVSAILAAISGYVLSLEGGYHEITLQRHQWFGIGTAIFSLIVLGLHEKNQTSKLSLTSWVVLTCLVMITGHLGGELTHGSTFLSEPFSSSEREYEKIITNIDSALVYQDIVHPIFKRKCISCHNENKLKGDLLMTNPQSLQKGGKTGAFFVAENVAQSLFLQRIHKPLEDKKHMPPSGKQQLDKDEITLLEWWIENGAAFDKKVVTLRTNENVRAILTNYEQRENSILNLAIDPVSAEDIITLKNAGIQVEQLVIDKPFLSASLRGQQDINKQTFKLLSKISKQLISLDLSNSNIDDQLITYLESFPHLQKLFLQKTKITGKNLSKLQALSYLEYLNLYQTPLEEKYLDDLKDLPALQDLYLWQTDISSTAIQGLQTAKPQLAINFGIDRSIFGKAKLQAPLIIGKDIFTDTLSVKLKSNYKNVQLYYTLDGSTPDSNSNQYQNPILLNSTAQIKVFAKKEGWLNSDIHGRSIVKAKYQIADIQLSPPPDKRYQSDGPKSLINLEKGTDQFTDGKWLGYEKEHVTATLDIGQKESISTVSVSALESTGSYIFFPKSIEVSISTNGKKFQRVSQMNIPITAGPEPPALKNFILRFPTTEARYVRVNIKGNLVNPKWHPAPGAPCWVFLDEIVIE